MGTEATVFLLVLLVPASADLPLTDVLEGAMDLGGPTELLLVFTPDAPILVTEDPLLRSAEAVSVVAEEVEDDEEAL